MTYRLHIDIPINGNEADALRIAEEIIRFGFNNAIAEKHTKDLGVESINYRLGHDDDRQKSNYFVKNSSGHANNKKSKIVLIPSLTETE